MCYHAPKVLAKNGDTVSFFLTNQLVGEDIDSALGPCMLIIPHGNFYSYGKRNAIYSLVPEYIPMLFFFLAAMLSLAIRNCLPDTLVPSRLDGAPTQ